MHIPSDTTNHIDILRFGDALTEEQTTAHEYDQGKWLYVPCHYSEYRYILGTKGVNPLICIGINPSTAAPDDLDNTLKSVERIAHFNGFDSFIMFNVYAQRATRPDDMEKTFNQTLHAENMKAFEYVLSLYGEGHTPTVWAAWGTIVEMRDYLPICIRDMVTLGNRYGATWVSAGKKSKKGHPHHPLYLKKDSVTEEFDVDTYLQMFE
ncbi:MAG: DUF1643 domain-containing protein [Clostridia bacterium]|nr:DUF1643 domain-containing protein [Clostridia bacterium]